MAYNEEIAKRIRQGIQGVPHITEKRMFGGIVFMYKNKMTIGVVKDQICVRIVGERFEQTLTQDHVSPMDFTGKALKEFVYVSGEGFESGEALQNWIELGVEHAIRATS